MSKKIAEDNIALQREKAGVLEIKKVEDNL